MQPVYFNPYSQQPTGEQTFLAPTVFFPQQISPRLINEQQQIQQNMINEMPSNKFPPIQPSPYMIMSPPHSLVSPGQQQQQPIPGFHPIPMMSRFYTDPMHGSANGQPMISPHQHHQQQQQQLSPTVPVLYASSPSTPWIPAGAQPSPYFILPHHQQAQPFPFQQLI